MQVQSTLVWTSGFRCHSYTSRGRSEAGRDLTFQRLAIFQTILIFNWIKKMIPNINTYKSISSLKEDIIKIIHCKKSHLIPFIWNKHMRHTCNDWFPRARDMKIWWVLVKEDGVPQWEVPLHPLLWLWWF